MLGASSGLEISLFHKIPWSAECHSQSSYDTRLWLAVPQLTNRRQQAPCTLIASTSPSAAHTLPHPQPRQAILVSLTRGHADGHTGSVKGWPQRRHDEAVRSRARFRRAANNSARDGGPSSTGLRGASSLGNWVPGDGRGPLKVVRQPLHEPRLEDPVS